jgi:membrane protein
MPNLSTYLDRLKRVPRYYARGLYRQLSDKDVFLWAQAIAFKVLITIVPVIILATGVLGQILRRAKPFEVVRRFIEDFLPPYRSEGILAFLQQLADASGKLTLVGVFGLLFSAVILFTTLRVAVSNVFQEEWHENRTILGGYLFDIRMVGQVGLFFILSLGLTLATQYLNTAGAEFIERVGLNYVWLRQGWRQAFQLLSLLIPFLLTTAMFFQLLYFIPKPHPPRRSVLIGALTTGVLWEAAKYGFTFYATRAGRFDYGGEGSTPIGDTFGIIIAFVFWVYYSGIVLLIGAVVALLHEKAHRARRQTPSEAAAEDEAERETAPLPDDAPEDTDEPPPTDEASEPAEDPPRTNGHPDVTEAPSEDQSVRS